MTTLTKSTQPTHADTPEAFAVSNMRGLHTTNKITTAYSREKQLLLGHAPTAVEAGGTPVHGHTPREAFRLAGADFRVETRPMAFLGRSPETGDPTDPHCWQSTKLCQAMVRTDTNRMLAQVGPKYHPLQQEYMINLFEYLREDAVLDNIVAIRGGVKVVATASINLSGNVGDTKVCRFLHAGNSFDGSTKFFVYFSDMMWVCANQISFITGKGARNADKSGQGLALRHTASAEEMAKQLPQLIDLQQQQFRRELEILQPMAGAPLTRSAANAILSATFADKLAKPIPVERGSSELRQRTLDDLYEVDCIRSHYSGSTGIEVQRGTVWGLFQAITQNQCHDFARSESGAEKQTNAQRVNAARARLEALWGGQASQRIERAKEACLAALA